MSDMPPKWRYFEDLVIGQKERSKGLTLDRDKMVAFAREYDPQYFHADEAAAQDHKIFQGITASGIYTAALWRILDHDIYEDVAWVCGLGWDEVRWRKPLKPDDVIYATAEVLEKRPWPKDPNIGRVTVRHEIINQRGEMVFGYYGDSLVHRRPPDDEG